MRGRGALLMLAGLPLLLTGCAVDAGSGAVDDFTEHMRDQPAVVEVGGLITNSLPFSGGGMLILTLDPSASEQELTDAAARAMEFRPAPGATISAIIFDLTTEPIDRGAYLQPGQGNDVSAPHIMLDVPWGEDAAPAVKRLHEVAQLPGMRVYRDLDDDLFEGEERQRLLMLDAPEDACSTLERLRELEGERDDPFRGANVHGAEPVDCR